MKRTLNGHVDTVNSHRSTHPSGRGGGPLRARRKVAGILPPLRAHDGAGNRPGPLGSAGEGLVVPCPAMTEQPLRSATYDVADLHEATELFQRNGWTDGLPIVPPTEDLVRRFVEASGFGPADGGGTEPVRRRRITAEKVAIAAVMAGGLPE